MNDMVKHLEKIREGLILAIVVLFPFTFVGSFIDQTNLPKLILLITLICLTLLLVAGEIYFTSKLVAAKGKFDLAVFVIAMAYFISAIFITPNKMQAFFEPGTASFVIG